MQAHVTDIFLSYSSADRVLVRPLRDALDSLNYRVFWDLETPIGENWDRWIRKQISIAKIVIVCWTQNAAASENVQHEAAIARDSHKLIPIVLERMAAVDLPMGFYTTQAALLHDWRGSHTHEGFSKLLDLVNKRLEGGDGAAMAALRSEAADVAYLHQLASEGDVHAQAELGFRYLKGIGVSSNETEAVRHSQSAAAAGNARAENNLALMHERGLGGLEVDFREARRLLHQSAGRGFAAAQRNLGLSYFVGGEGYPKDEQLAAMLLRLAADQGDSAAQAKLGSMLLSGTPGVPPDEKEALQYCRLAAAKGSSNAQAILGLMYLEGLGGLDKDIREAARLFELAAASGSTLAMINLGGMYKQGAPGLAINESRAVELYRLATEKGSTVGMNNLGVMYRDGRGVRKDEKEAVRLFRLAADRGEGIAQFNLGWCWETGLGGLKKNRKQAKKLYNLAADQGVQLAADALKRLV